MSSFWALSFRNSVLVLKKSNFLLNNDYSVWGLDFQINFCIVIANNSGYEAFMLPHTSLPTKGFHIVVAQFNRDFAATWNLAIKIPAVCNFPEKTDQKCTQYFHKVVCCIQKPQLLPVCVYNVNDFWKKTLLKTTNEIHHHFSHII